MKVRPCLVAAYLALPLHASPRTSANYQLMPEIVDGGGGRSSSPHYTLDSSLAPSGGLSSASSAQPMVAKTGYVGQLYEPLSLVLTADPAPEIGEGGSVQLGAMVVLDDYTLLEPGPGSVGWSVVTGPLTGIDAAGLVTADLVWEDSPASVGAVWGGVTGQLGLTVLDTDPDNFGSYAGDGLDDDWQFGFFGPDSPLAGPDIDADGDGDDNRFEHEAGVSPIDPLSRFRLSIHSVPGHPIHRDLVFSPRWEDRNYAVEMSSGPEAPWLPLASSSQSDAGDKRTVTDLDASDAVRLYRVGISRHGE